LCELNDLKRTIETAAIELGYSTDELENILNGYTDESKVHKLIEKMGTLYPIDHLQLSLLRDDTINGIKFFSASSSQKSKRTYKRTNRHAELTNYYEYRDTAMSKLSLFKPEWIAVLREVNDSNAHNLDIVMNNGHFMHQVTMFIGPVNFYYEDSNGDRHCCEMNTGDSNYITPFMKHSFASRDKNKFTCIIAVTFGADVSRSQRELYALGEIALKSYIINNNQNGSRKLIKQYMKNNFFTVEILNSITQKDGVDIEKIFSSEREINHDEYKIISKALGVEVGNLQPPRCGYEQECIIKYINETNPMTYTVANQSRYKIHTLAKTLKIPSMTSSIIEVLKKEHNKSDWFRKSLHTYIINFSDHPVEMKWRTADDIFTKVIEKYDSVYLKPFIEFSFANKSSESSSLFVVGIPTSVGTQAQKELSSLMEPNRVINDLERWYDY